MGHLVDVVVARLGNVLLAAHPLPRLRPDLLAFELEHFTGVVAREVDVLAAEILVVLVSQNVRRLQRITPNDLLDGRGGATCLAGTPFRRARHSLGQEGLEIDARGHDRKYRSATSRDIVVQHLVEIPHAHFLIRQIRVAVAA